MLKAIRNRKVRGVLIQVGILAAAALLTLTFVLTARENLVSQGIATGFGFLERSTGWPINFALFEVSDRSTYARMLLAGFVNTFVASDWRATLSYCGGLSGVVEAHPEHPRHRLRQTFERARAEACRGSSVRGVRRFSRTLPPLKKAEGTTNRVYSIA